MSGNSSKLIAMNYMGSKFTWVDWLLPYFPRHIHFIDVAGGSLAVTLNKPFSRIDTANDINGEVVNFFRVLREQPDELITLLALTPIAREEYDKSWDMTGANTDLERARRFYVRSRQSFYGMGVQKRSKGWHMVKTSSRSNRAETVSKWHNALAKLYPVADKLRNIQIENDCFRTLIPKLDFAGAFFFTDFPYHEDCRASENDYTFEFTAKDHEEAAELLNNIKGKAMVSTYVSETMAKLYKGWHFVKFPSKKNNIRKTDVQECIYMNYDPAKEYMKFLNDCKRSERKN